MPSGKVVAIDGKALSRFAEQEPKPRPTHTLIVPTRAKLAIVLKVLLDEGEVFTVEPSPVQPDVWHLGVFETAIAGVVAAMEVR